jgi:hypothetical protein
MMAQEIIGLNALLRTFRTYPKELSTELRARSQRIAEPIAAEARDRATSPQQKLVAPSIRAVRDRIPVVKVGGGTTLKSSTPRRRQPKAGQVYFGADFGSSLPQFPGKTKGGRMIFKAVKGQRNNIADEYLGAVEDIFGKRL